MSEEEAQGGAIVLHRYLLVREFFAPPRVEFRIPLVADLAHELE
jgi:hypothetical protein